MSKIENKSQGTTEERKKQQTATMARLKANQAKANLSFAEAAQSCDYDVLSNLEPEIAKVIKQKEMSPPMSKSRMMTILNIDSYEIFNKFAERHGLKELSRKSFQICLDEMSEREKEKLRKA